MSTENVNGSHQALISSARSSSISGAPSSPMSGSAEPDSTMAMLLAPPSAQSAAGHRLRRPG